METQLHQLSCWHVLTLFECCIFSSQFSLGNSVAEPGTCGSQKCRLLGMGLDHALSLPPS